MEASHVHIPNGSTSGAYPEPASDAGCALLCRLLAMLLQPLCIYRIDHGIPGTCDVNAPCCLIILLPDSCTRPMAEYDPVIRLTQLLRGQVHCYVHHAHTVRNWISKGHPFFCRHLVADNIIYSDGPVALAPPPPPVLAQLKTGLRRQFSVFFGKAADFLRCADHLHEQHGGGCALVAFMLHQAVELGFRSILESLNGCCRKTHDIRELRIQCLRCAPALAALFPDDTAAERQLLDTLQKAYSGARYDNGFSISEADTVLLVRRATCFLEAAWDTFDREIGQG